MRKFADPREAELAIEMLKFFAQEPNFVRAMYVTMEPRYPDITRDRVRAVWNRLEQNGYLQKLAGNTRDLVLGTTEKGRHFLSRHQNI